MNTLQSDSGNRPLASQSLVTLPFASEPDPTAVPTTAPLAAPAPTPEPTTTPLPTPSPTPEPTATAAPTATPLPTPPLETAAESASESDVAAEAAAEEAVAAPTAAVEAALAEPEQTPAIEPTATSEVPNPQLPDPDAPNPQLPDPDAPNPQLPDAQSAASPPLATATAVPVQPTPIQSQSVVTAQSASDLESFVLGEINQVRATAGLAPLILDSRISEVSRDWSQQMATGGFFQHRSSDQLNTMLPSGWRQWGENIASAPDIFWAQTSLERSPGHYANMVGSFTHIGIGVYEQGGQVWLTQNFARY